MIINMPIVYLITQDANQQCGIVDYTLQLENAVNALGAEAVIEKIPTWSFAALFKLKEKYRKCKKLVLHLQYPSLGIGKSIAPALIPFVFKNSRVSITFHEFKQFNPIRKFYFFLTTWTKAYYIFTNEYEQGQFLRLYPWVKDRCTIVPIGNNISLVPLDKKNAEVQERLVYFGQIAANKGIEEFLETVKLLRGRGNQLDCVLMGALLDPESELSQKVEVYAKQYDIKCLYNLPAESVSHELQKSSIALLPFPQGVSDKRGSALACLKHGLTLITKHDEITPSWWRATTYNAADAEEAVETILGLTDNAKERHPHPEILANALIEREWQIIGQAHLKHYA